MNSESFVDRMISIYSASADNLLYSEQLWPKTLVEADKIIDLLCARPPAHILDLACGSGAVTTAMALKGFDVTGVDCTPAMLDIAKEMSLGKGAAVTWRCLDIREIEFEESMEYVLLRDVIFGVFDNEQEDMDLLRSMSRALMPCGRCLIEVYDKGFALNHGVENALFYDECSDRFVVDDKVGAAQSVKLYSLSEWESMLAATGLRLVRTDGWKWSRDPTPPPWRANCIVAEKPPGKARHQKGNRENK